MYTVNHLENFALHLEHDEGHDEGLISQDVIDATAREKLIFCTEDSDRVLEDCSYLWVDPHYIGQLSPGQQRLYEILLSIQQGTVYSVTTVGRLAEAQDLKNPLSCCERLGNLQSLGAISGYRG